MKVGNEIGFGVAELEADYSRSGGLREVLAIAGGVILMTAFVAVLLILIAVSQ